MGRLRALIDRIRGLPPLWFDVGLAALVLLLSLLTIDSSGDATTRDPDVWEVLGLVAVSAALAFRRRWPVTVLVLVAGGTFAILFADYPENAVAVAPLIVLYTVAAYRDRRVSLIAGGITVGIVLVILLVAWAGGEDDVDAAAVIANTAVLIAAWALGDNIRSRRERQAALEARAEQAERERELLAREAVEDERARIARELHDVVAHNVSVMVVQAGAGRRVIDDRPERAREALESIERTGRAALTEMRRLLDVLRRDDEATDALAPQPGVERLDALIARTREAGLPVELVVEGERRPLPAGVDLQAFRIVQEALTNSLKHAAPARARVVLRYGDDDLEVLVSDDGRGAARALQTGDAAGHGLLGMRERVALFGGELEAGPAPGGGFATRARLPLAQGGR